MPVPELADPAPPADLPPAVPPADPIAPEPAPAPLSSGVAVAPGDPLLPAALPFDYEGILDLDEEVGIIKLSDETGPQVLKMIEMYTERNILPAQNLPQVQINFDSRTPMTKGEALVALESLLSMNGIALTKINQRFWKAVPAVGINQQVPVWLYGSPNLQPPSEKIYTTLFQLDYLPVKDLMTSLSEFGSKSFKPVPFEKANNVLVTDSMLNLQRMEMLIERLDRPVVMSSETILFIKTQHVNVADVQRRLSTMAEGSLKRYLGGN
ncbi:MAG: secretin N-terminal domain-containing protein, partial [Opitutales bacterium]